jgi:undecaprenyl diphosphate synthase
MTIPNHVAIIMDGNGRWAKSRGRTRTYGHIRGAYVARKIISESVRQNIKTLTLFAFSTENWLRPNSEVSFLMRLLAHRIRRERDSLMKRNVRFHVIGETQRLPYIVRDLVESTVKMTENNTGMNLVFALSYGGRQDIVEAARRLANRVAAGEILPHQITDGVFASELQTRLFSDPDLIIRTSGELRISNFLLWQAAYSELYFTEKLWPDFTTADYLQAFIDYSQRHRRFGRVDQPTSGLDVHTTQHIQSSTSAGLAEQAVKL